MPSEIVGDDLLGDDLLGDELLGAADIVGVAAGRNAYRQALQQRGRLVHQTQPTKDRDLILGFDSVTNVAAAAAASITSRPQTIFRPERVVLSSAIADFFLFTDIRVGKNSQFTAAGAVPGATFAQSAFGVRLKMDTCQVAMDVVMNVTNIDAAAHRFTAALIGPSVE